MVYNLDVSRIAVAMFKWCCDLCEVGAGGATLMSITKL
jgi:hypothetical protein